MEGYKDPQTYNHKLRGLISQNKISRNSRNTEKFVAIWVEGLKTEVEKLYTEIEEFVAELPEEDKEDGIVFELDGLKDFVGNDRVCKLFEKIIK